MQFPTPESISGCELYMSKEEGVNYQVKSALDFCLSDSALLDEVYLVDFHRLTVMFAQLQSTYWKNQESQKHVLEFFAQITLSKECDLYIGFKTGVAEICGIASYSKDELLISDIVSLRDDINMKHTFVSTLLDKFNTIEPSYTTVITSN